MAKNTAAIPAKTTGNTYAAAEFEVLRGFVDAPSQALSTFTGSLITLDGTGSYDVYTLAANLSITFAESGHEEGAVHFVKIISDGTDTVTLIKPSAYTLLIPSSFTNGGILSTGIYIFAFAFIDGEIQMKYEAVNSVSAYVFANTHKLVISGVGDGVSVINDNMFPSGDYSIEIWGTTPSDINGSFSAHRMIDNNDDFILSDIGFGGGVLTGMPYVTFRTDGSNRMAKRASNAIVSASTLTQIVITKTGETYAGVKIYGQGVEASGYTDETVGTYAGIRPLVGNVKAEIPRLNAVTPIFDGVQIFRIYNAELSSAEVTTLFGLGSPVALTASLQSKCVQENLLNNNPNADNIGNNGTTEGSATYSTI
jgi:hypothetical protein